MKKSYSFFNTACLILMGIFLLGTIFSWRGEFVEAATNDVVSSVPILERNNEDKSDKMDEENFVEIREEEIEIKEDSPQSELGATKVSLSEANIPKQINLAVPFTSQAPEGNWDQPWQDACEEAAVLMLDAFYKDYSLSPLFSRDEILKLVAWEDELGWGYSIPTKQVGELAEENFGYKKYSLVENPTIDDIKKSIAAGHPVLAMAHGKSLDNPYFSGEGPEYHAVIIRGYTEDSFITNDPGTRRGENFVYSYDNLMNAIHDWNGGDVESGRKFILTLHK